MICLRVILDVDPPRHRFEQQQQRLRVSSFAQGDVGLPREQTVDRKVKLFVTQQGVSWSPPVPIPAVRDVRFDPGSVRIELDLQAGGWSLKIKESNDRLGGSLSVGRPPREVGPRGGPIGQTGRTVGRVVHPGDG